MALHESPANVSKPSGDLGPDVLREFISESAEHLDRAEQRLLDLEAPTSRDVAGINDVFRAFHTIKGSSAFLGLDRINALAHKAETLLDRVRTDEIALEGPYADAALETVDMLRKMIERMGRCLHGEKYEEPAGVDELLARLDTPETLGAAKVPRLGDLLVEIGCVDRKKIEEVAAGAGHGRLGEKLVRAGVVRPELVAEALRIQQAAAIEGDETVRVKACRLDQLAELTEELSVAEAVVRRDDSIGSVMDEILAARLDRLRRIACELRETAASMRRASLKGTFQKMTRVVRDAARKSGKSVRLVCHGERIEVDRAAAELLGEALLHMVRNAVDHGIEPLERRRRASKCDEGTIVLRAGEKESGVFIEVEDDGAGLDAEKIRAKAVERGLIEKDARVTEGELFGLLFAPGFSTVDNVTELSGRGVGLDVVSRNVSIMGGRIEVRSSRGGGTSFAIWLPKSSPEGSSASRPADWVVQQETTR